MTERAQALEAALRSLRAVVREFGIQDADDWIVAAIENADALLAVPPPPPAGSPTTEPMEREGVWNPNGEGQQPDIPGGIAKDHARAKRPVIAYACLYPKLAAVAREHGYALAMHGSLVADCDLVAVPWIAEASSGDDLARALAVAAPGYLILDTSDNRPAGVRKHVIHLGGGPYIDLAVCPQSASVSDDETTPCEHCGKRLARGAQEIHWTSDDVALCGDCMTSLLAVQPPPPVGSPTTEHEEDRLKSAAAELWWMGRDSVKDLPPATATGPQLRDRCLIDIRDARVPASVSVRADTSLSRLSTPVEPAGAACDGGVAVRWCPRCGTCTCQSQEAQPNEWVDDPLCPIHGSKSTHVEPAGASEPPMIGQVRLCGALHLGTGAVCELPLPVSPDPWREFRHEVVDKLSVASHCGRRGGRTHTEIVLKQCEDFLVEQAQELVDAARAADALRHQQEVAALQQELAASHGLMRLTASSPSGTRHEPDNGTH